MQSPEMVRQKNRLPVLCSHAALLAILSYLACGLWGVWQIPAVIFVTHALIDFVKARSGKTGPASFLIDQGAHGVVIALAAGAAAALAPAGPAWVDLLGGWYLKALLVMSGAIACVWMGGYLIGAAVRPMQRRLTEQRRATAPADGPDPAGFTDGGMMIGQLERALIFILTLTGQTAGIGFLIAAKSILRFGEAQDPAQRMEAEYIIIGTLMSFGWGILVSYLTVVFLQQL